LLIQAEVMLRRVMLCQLVLWLVQPGLLSDFLSEEHFETQWCSSPSVAIGQGANVF